MHGSVLENLASARHQLEVEMNSSTDNPLIFEDSVCPITKQPQPNVISAGNFHGEYPAKALDTLALYVGELGRMSVARTMLLIDPNRNRGLPAFVAPNPGVNSGFMCWELTAVRVYTCGVGAKGWYVITDCACVSTCRLHWMLRTRHSPCLLQLRPPTPGRARRIT